MNRKSILTDEHGKPIRDGLTKRVLVFPDMETASLWATEAYGDSKTTYTEPLEPIDASVTRQLRKKVKS